MWRSVKPGNPTRCRRVRRFSREPRLAFRTPRHGVRCSCGHRRDRAKLFSCTARTAAVQIARAYVMRVIGTAGTDEGLALVRAQGAHHVLNHREADYLQRLQPLTDGQGVNVVLEMLANVNLDHDLDVLAPQGRVVVIGNRGRVEVDPRKSMARDAAILGMTLFNETRAELEEIHAGLVAGLENGSLNPVIGKEFALADAAKAHVAVMESGALGKIVLIP